MKNFYLLLFVIISILLSGVFNFATAFAEVQQLAPGGGPQPDPNAILEQAGQGAQYNTQTQGTPTAIPSIIGQIIAVVLGFVGSIFLVLTIYSGIQWMTAGGNEDKVKQARTRLINSIMGLAITIAAYFITWLISTTLLGA